MAATLALSSPVCGRTVQKARTPSQRSAGSLPVFRPQNFSIGHVKRGQLAVVAALGGPDDKKVLRREEEPEEYWTSERERQGKSVFSDPLAIIGVLAIFFPFLILGVAIATGLVDLSATR